MKKRYETPEFLQMSMQQQEWVAYGPSDVNDGELDWSKE